MLGPVPRFLPAPSSCPHCGQVGCARPESEAIITAPTVLTFARTIGAVAVGLWAAADQSLTLLLVSLAIYWVGDVADGTLARLTDRETRAGAALDILADRLSAGVFYVGLVWLEPEMALPVGIYLGQFMLIDAYLSLAFLAWPLSSPNYFYRVDRTIWLLNWSKVGKAVNSTAFALLLVLTNSIWIGTAVASALFVLKTISLVLMAKQPIPVPGRCLDEVRRDPTAGDLVAASADGT